MTCDLKATEPSYGQDLDPDLLDDDVDDIVPSMAGTVRDLVSDGAKMRFDAWLTNRCAPDFSRSRLQALLADGRILIDGVPASSKSKPKAGQHIRILIPPPEPADPQPENIPLEILFEDEDVIVIDKQPGLVVHPAAGHSSGTLVNALLFHCKDLQAIGETIRPGIVHRLDKDTSGVMVCAKNDRAMNALSLEFKNRGTHKAYLALVHGSPGALSGTVSSTIGRDPHDRKRMAANPLRGKAAVSHWELVERFPRAALLRVRIETGRTHQIRVHLSSIGLPIVGDPLYGNSRADRSFPGCPSRQMLHAAELAFDHPADGHRMHFTASPPRDMAELLGMLRQRTVLPAK